MVFVVSGLVAVAGQLRITRWFTQRWGSGHSLVIGMLILAAAFTPMIAIPNVERWGGVAAATALVVAAAVLAVGSAAVFPFEMDTVVSLAENRLVGTHYGFYNTIVGIGILAGNLATGALMQAAREAGRDEVVWVVLTAIGLIAAAALYRLDRTGRLVPESAKTTTHAA